MLKLNVVRSATLYFFGILVLHSVYAEDYVTTDASSNMSAHHHNVHAEAAHGHSSIIVTLMYPIVILTLGAFVEHFFSESAIPYTVIIFLVGATFGIIQLSIEGPIEETNCTRLNTSACIFGDLSVSANEVAGIDPHFMLNLFLPILIFESAFSVEWHVFKNVMGYAALLAGPGLVISSALTAVWVIYCRYNTETIGTNWGDSERRWAMGLLFGAIASATDPVAVVSVLKTVGAAPHLSITIEGESLLNDGVAVVAFYVLFDSVRYGIPTNGVDVTVTFLEMAGLGILWGLFMGMIFTSWISVAYDQALVEITATVMAAYLTFFIGEEYFHVSGVLAVVALGIYFSAVGHYSITPRVHHELHGLWQWLGFLANTLIFGITGLLITRPTIEMVNESADAYLALVFNCFMLNVALFFIRAFIFLICYPVLHYCGSSKRYKMDWRDCFVSAWGALRGAVGLALAMVVSLDARHREVNADPCTFKYDNETKLYDITDNGICGGISLNNTADTIAYKRFSEHLLIGVASIVVFTLLFNSTTIKPLMNCLKMNSLSSVQIKLFELAMEKIDESAMNEISVLQADHSLQGVEWDIVKDARYKVTHRNELMMSAGLVKKLREMRRSALMKTTDAKLEARRRFLAACMSAYHSQNEKAVLSGRSLRILTEANATAVDHDCNLEIEWTQVVKSVPFLRLAEYMQNINSREELFNVSCAQMCKLLFTRKVHIFLFLLHLKTRRNKCLNWIVGRFVVSSIGRACDTASAFMDARDEAITLLSNYLQQPQHSTFYAAAQADMAKAYQAVLCCQRFFPDIVRSAETNRATRIILHHQKEQTSNLVHEGVLDRNLGMKVVHSLDKRIQRVMLKQRLCPKLSPTKKHVLLNQIQWLDKLSAKVMLELEKVTITNEFKVDEIILDFGIRPEYIYIISQGTVNIHMGQSAKQIKSTMSLHWQSQSDSPNSKSRKTSKSKKTAVFPMGRIPEDEVNMAGGANQITGLPSTTSTNKHNDLKRRPSSKHEITENERRKTLIASASSRDFLLGKFDVPVLQLHAGASIGELAWINEMKGQMSKTKFCAVASSTTVDVIAIPIDFVKNNTEIQQNMWMTTGRKIVETILRKQSRFRAWPKQQLVREVAKWNIEKTATLASSNHYTAVSFCMPIVLMHGTAFKLKHKSLSKATKALVDISDADVDCKSTEHNDGLADFHVILTEKELNQQTKAGNLICHFEGPKYLRPHVSDERLDDPSQSAVTWYLRSDSWVCFNDHTRFEYITRAGQSASEQNVYSNMRSVFRKLMIGSKAMDERAIEIAHCGSIDQPAENLSTGRLGSRKVDRQQTQFDNYQSSRNSEQGETGKYSDDSIQDIE